MFRCVLAFLLSTSLRCITVQNLKLVYFKSSVLRMLPRASQAICQLPPQAWFHYRVSSSAGYLGWFRSKSPLSRIIPASPYPSAERYSLLFLHIQGNIWKHLADFYFFLFFFNVTRCWDSLFQSLLEQLPMEIVGKRLWSVCLMAELQPETLSRHGSGRDWVCSAVLRGFPCLDLDLGFMRACGVRGVRRPLTAGINFGLSMNLRSLSQEGVVLKMGVHAGERWGRCSRCTAEQRVWLEGLNIHHPPLVGSAALMWS